MMVVFKDCIDLNGRFSRARLEEKELEMNFEKKTRIEEDYEKERRERKERIK